MVDLEAARSHTSTEPLAPLLHAHLACSRTPRVAAAAGVSKPGAAIRAAPAPAATVPERGVQVVIIVKAFVVVQEVFVVVSAVIVIDAVVIVDLGRKEG